VIQALALPKWMCCWVILLCYIIGGCIMDASRSCSSRFPSSTPGHPAWLRPDLVRTVITIVTTMGSIMPPIGICCYVVSGISGIPLGTVFRGSFYYMPSYIVSIIILMISPYWTVLVLSDLVK